MPNLNLKDDEVVHEEPMAPRLRRRDEGTQSKATTVVLYIVLVIVILGAAAFFLNKYGVIKLWGSKPTIVKRVAPPTPASLDSLAAAEEAAAAAAKPEAGKTAAKTEIGKKAAKTPAKAAPVASPAPKETKPARTPVPLAQPAASGEFAVQISSWPEEEKAVAHANQLRESGLDAYVVKAGERWTVRVGRYPSQTAAREEAKRLGENAEGRVIVVKAQ